MSIVCSHIQTCWHEYPNCLGNFSQKKIKFDSSHLSKWKGNLSLEFGAVGSEAPTVASDSEIINSQLSMDSTKNSSLTHIPSLQNDENGCNGSVKFLSSRNPPSSTLSKEKIEKLAGSEILVTSTSGRNSKPVELLSPRSQRLNSSSLKHVNFGPSPPSSTRTRESESSTSNGKARESYLSVPGHLGGSNSLALSNSSTLGRAKKTASSSSSRSTMSTLDGRSSTTMSQSTRSSLLTTSKEKKQGEDENVGGRTSSSSSRPGTQLVHQPKPALAADDDYAFFAKYTYSSECALLGYNFHSVISQLGIFEIVSYPHDYRLISVTLAYIFFKYRIHHCDMALDLALTLMYLEELSVPTLLSFESNDAFNVVCYFAFLAHVYNADRTIRLTDWYKEMNRVGSPNTFANCKAANKFVWFLFKDVRGLRLMPDESRVKKYIQRLCAAPQPQLMSSSKSSKTAQDKKK